MSERGDVLKRIRERFTKWYVKRGYKFGYGPCKVYTDGVLVTPMEMPECYFICPWWVKPLLIFFSPSVYTRETICKWMVEGLKRGIEEGTKTKEVI